MRSMLVVQKLRLGLGLLALLTVIQAALAIVGLNKVRSLQAELSDRALPIMVELSGIAEAAVQIAQKAQQLQAADAPGQVSRLALDIEEIGDRIARGQSAVIALDPALREDPSVALTASVTTGIADLVDLELARFSLDADYDAARAEVADSLKDLLAATLNARDTASLALTADAGDVEGIGLFRRMFQIHQQAERIAAALAGLDLATSNADTFELRFAFDLDSRDLHKAVARLQPGDEKDRIGARVVALHDSVERTALFDRKTAINTSTEARAAHRSGLIADMAALQRATSAIADRQQSVTQGLDRDLAGFTNWISRLLIGLSVMACLAVLVLGFLVVERQIARRLSRVMAATEALEAGDHAPRDSFDGTDEIAALGRAIDRLRALSRTQAELHQHLRDASDEAQKAAATKSEFLSMMSHEIRTPLNAILGLFDVMRNSGLDEKQLRRIEVGHKAASNLFKMLSDILDASRLEAGQIAVNPETIQASELRDYAEFLLAGTRRKHDRDIEIAATLAEGADIPLWIDVTKARQILANLIDNAVRFTMHGSVTVSMSISNDDGNLLITIRDTGSGISPEQISKIFEPFRQARMGINRGSGGSGLGLTISKQLAQLMGGDLSVQSEVGVASVFRLTLPVSCKELSHVA